MSIRQDSRTKRWYYRFYRGRSYFKGGVRTYDQGKDAEVKHFDRVIERGTHPERPLQDLALAEAGNLFFEKHSKINKRSWKNDRARVAHIARFFGKKLMREVTPEELEQFLNATQKK